MITASNLKLCSICINRSMSGMHWNLLMLFARNHIEWYDSFAHSPQFYNVQLPFGLKTKFANVNTVPHQSDTSSLCGMFCLYVFYQRVILRRPFQEIMHRDFNPFNKSQNDTVVSRFYNSICSCTPVRRSDGSCLVCKPRK